MVRFPPREEKTTTLLKLPTAVGLNVTWTEPVVPGNTRKSGAGTAKGKVVEAVPVRSRPPILAIWKDWV